MVFIEKYEVGRQKWEPIFNDPKRSNVVFEARDGQTFHCDKLVLEVASPYFGKLFSCQEGSKKFVSMKDVDPAALKWILRACYTFDGELNDENVVSVMVTAKMFEMDWVEKACMSYLKKDNSQPTATFKFSHEVQKWQQWTVPHSGWYHIVAMGAKAADQPRPYSSSMLYKATGGKGAIVGGSFELKSGDNIQILTGGMSKPWGKSPNSFTGGGGGSFVALKKEQLTLLLAAGGGGSPNQGIPGSDANLGEEGLGSGSGYAGGKNGGSGASTGANIGGLGWKAGPVALAKPRTAASTDSGGFGGGGNACGGGGGYSGGSCGTSAAGGGGSFISSRAVNAWKRLGNFGQGKVSIWHGKNMPALESTLMDQIGNPDGGTSGHATNDSSGNWEVVD